ncbi:Chromate resistance protein ChrB [Nakamurella sp. A5-74]|uniref:Chromate resistance protein ChrB n=1 Tax=Nakamurella sp. A5-74 TaxID=3158264 RepID=A0AAU8DSV0_9ACTN
MAGAGVSSPSKPTRLRATVWRRLEGLGAIYLQNSAAALPASVQAERALRTSRHDILSLAGSAVLLNRRWSVGRR